MGCCISRPDTGQSPYRETPRTPTHPDASSRHITAGSNHTSTTSHPAPPPAAALTPNQPLKPIPQEPCARLPSPAQATSVHNRGPWTSARLARERNDWWDTRTEGSRYIWQTYQEAVRLAQEGDLKNAQAVIDAAGCTCPTGELWKRIYDDQGVEYSVSRSKWVVLEPEGIVSEGDVGVDGQQDGGRLERAGSSSVEGPPAADIESPISPVQSQSSRPPIRGKITCRLSDTGKDLHVSLDAEGTVGDLITAIQSKVGHHDKRLRVAFLGHEHTANEFLRDFYLEGKVLTIMVLPVVE